MVIVDDHHLFAVLAGHAPPELQTEAVFTTSCWYYRLARAVHDQGFTGALSRQVDALDPGGRQLVVDQIDELPAAIGLLSARALVPVMAKVAGTVQLNLLAAEAVSAAVILDAGLRVVASSPHLQTACERLGIELLVAPTS